MAKTFNMVGGGGGIRLASISVTHPPTKTAYKVGETFSASGMVVTAVYTNGATKVVTDYTFAPTTPLTLSDTDITLTYTEGGVTRTVTQAISVTRTALAVPTQSGTLTYSGSSQAPQWSGYDSTRMTLGGVVSGVNAGSYNATFTLKDTSAYQWSDGTTAAKTVAWSIGKAAGSMSLDKTEITLSSDKLSDTVTVTRLGDGAISAVSNDTSVATVSVSGNVVTVQSAGGSGNAIITISVAAGTNYEAPADRTAAVTAAFEHLVATPLSAARGGLAATTVGDYALFGGGGRIDDIYHPHITNDAVNTVDAYDTTLVRSTPTALSAARGLLAATTVGNYALFGGGDSDSGAQKKVVDAYDTALVRSTPTTLGTARNRLAAATVGEYGLFVGGTGTGAADAYNTTLVRSSAQSRASSYKGDLAATTVGNYALFGGGKGGGSGETEGAYNYVDAYDTTLVRSTPTALSAARGRFAATTVGNYGLFGGGYGSSYSNVVDAYDTTLVRSTPTALSKARGLLAATTVGNYALFGGGSYSNVVDAYDNTLVHSVRTPLSAARYCLAATTVGNYALFGGGLDGTRNSDVVDAYNLT